MITQEFLNQSIKRGMKKSAQMSDSAKSSLIGAGMGAGLGGLAWLLRPKDRDQNQWREALISILGGAALGGAGGWGFHHLTNKTPVDAATAVADKTRNIVSDVIATNEKHVDSGSKEKQEQSQQTKITPNDPIDRLLARESLEAARRNRGSYTTVDTHQNKKPAPEVKTTRNAPFRVKKTVGGKNRYYTDRESWNWGKRPDDPTGQIVWSTMKKLDNSLQSQRAKGLIALFENDKSVPKGSLPLYVEVPNNDTFRVVYKTPAGVYDAWTWERK